MIAMITLPSLLAFLLPLPAVKSRSSRTTTRRRRAVRDLALSSHILRDAGLEQFDNQDPRWTQRPDLER